MANIKFVFKNPNDIDDGRLVTPTSVKLSSEDGTYGVKRNDTSGVVVPDDIAFETLGTGIFGYSFQEPAYNLQYTYSVETVHNGTTYYNVYDDLDGTYVQTNKLYATVAEWKVFVDYTTNAFTDTDAEIKNYLTLASRMIDDFCHTNFYNNYKYNRIPDIVHEVCMIVATRIRLDPSNADTNATSESIGRYSYTGNSTDPSAISGLIPSEYTRLIPFRILKRL